MSPISPYALGATLYMPATRPDLFDVVCNGKIRVFDPSSFA